MQVEEDINYVIWKHLICTLFPVVSLVTPLMKLQAILVTIRVPTITTAMFPMHSMDIFFASSPQGMYVNIHVDSNKWTLQSYIAF